jgi:hypothetical protein
MLECGVEANTIHAQKKQVIDTVINPFNTSTNLIASTAQKHIKLVLLFVTIQKCRVDSHDFWSHTRTVDVSYFSIAQRKWIESVTF